MTAVVIGASAGLGRALSVQLAASGHDLLLVASDLRDLEPLCDHLALSYGITARMISVDASDPEKLGSALRTAFQSMNDFSLLFAPIGASRADDDLMQTPLQAQAMVRVNFLSVLTAVQTALPYLQNKQNARIVGFGSIATVRGRGQNVVYSAAKRGLASYFESLRHGLAKDPVTVQFYQMGYIETQQLYGQKTPLPHTTNGQTSIKRARL